MSNRSAQRLSIPGLAAVNAALVIAIALTLVVSGRRAQAQPDAPARARGAYTMVASHPSLGGTSAALYIIDENNQELIAVRWDQSRQSLAGVGYRNLVADASAQPGR